MSLEAISVQPKTGQPPQGLFIALHGWGANAQDVASLANFLRLDDYQIFFPNAPFPHPYEPMGRQWYELPHPHWYDSSTPDFQGLVQSRKMLKNWLQSLRDSTGIPLSRTVLAGFSQGGAMALDVGLSLPLQALCIMSGYLHPHGQLGSQTPPVLIVHGKKDQVVPCKKAQQARDELTALGVKVKYQELEMGHEIPLEVLELMSNFVRIV